MNKPEAKTNSLIYYRLIALWVLAEAMLGGIIHGFRIPVSGLVVGSCAVICICLIAYYVPKKGSILKATIIVAIFKMMLSPQAPPPAYFAVFFQGLMGELLFWNRSFFRLSCMLLAVLSLLESGFQRILMLTIIYGNDLWTAINDFLNRLTKQKATTNYSLLLGGGYVLLHLIVGLVVGWWASVLPGRVARWNEEKSNRMNINYDAIASLPARSKKRERFKKGMFVMWIIFMGLYAQSYLKIGKPLLPPDISLKILLRSMIIVLTWYFIISPLLKRLLHKWLQKRKVKSRPDVQRVLQLLPATVQLVAQSWKASGDMIPPKRGWQKFKDTIKRILVNALHSTELQQVWIMSGLLQTGKTTSLVSWSADRNDVAGILTPVVNGKRYFMDAKTREQFTMEAEDGETDVLKVGRFVFSKDSFDRATQIISDSIHRDGWLVIDEIGPLELRGEGFSEIVKEALQYQPDGQTIMLVVRESLVEQVKEYFELPNASVIKKSNFKGYLVK